MSWWISSKNKIIIKKNPNPLVLAEQFTKEAFAHGELLHQQVLELQQQLDYKCASRLNGRFTLIFIFFSFSTTLRDGKVAKCHGSFVIRL
jgi:hypothetical protein